jgi:hypothetical protein
VQICHLLHICLTKLFTLADIISIYSLVGDLQKALNPKSPEYNDVKEVSVLETCVASS